MSNPDKSSTEVMSNKTEQTPVTPAGREHCEPVCGNEPMPLWLIVVTGAALFIAGAYLGIFNGGFRGDVFNERESSPALLFPEKAAAGAVAATSGVAVAETESPVVRGKKFYSNPPASCVTCHQPTGKGLPGSFPPLAGSEYVQGGSKRLGMILLKGLQGPIKVQGTSFNGAMPAWEKVLNDKQIAYILTYVRQEWGNKASEITPDQIAAARKEFSDRSAPWSEADLLAVPADAELPGGTPAAGVPAAPEVKK
ncbi:MAG: cytochrome c [Verrucomicrobiota bacterium]